MTTTEATDTPTDRPDLGGGSVSPTASRSLRSAGLAGFGWLTLLIVTNIVNGAVSPAPDATVDEVVAHLRDDRAVIYLLTAAFVLGTPLVFWFVAGIANVLRQRGHHHAADAGLVAIAGVFTMFGLAAITRLSLVAAVETDAVESSAVWTLWKLHDVAFMVNGAAMCMAFLAFGLAGAATGLVHHWFSVAAPVGAVTLLGSASFLALPVAEGSSSAMVAGLVGFLIWLTFVGAASLGLLRQPRAA